MKVPVNHCEQEGYRVSDTVLSCSHSITAMDDASKSSHIVTDFETLCASKNGANKLQIMFQFNEIACCARMIWQSNSKF